LDRKAYYFTKENNRILDIEDKRIINYIFSLPNRAEFEVVMEEIKIESDAIKEKQPLIKKTGKSKKGGK